VGTAGDQAATELHTAVLGPHTRRLMVVSDLRLILPASGVDDGLAVVGGTGSRAIGVLAGREVYAGGYGWLLGDEGSGWWVVREGLRVVLARLDAGQPPGELGALLLAHASLTDPGELLWSVYARADPGFWAGAAAAVLACDDPAAPAILAASADALVALIEQAGDALDGQAALSASLPVVLAGGLLVGHRPLTEAVRTRLADAGHPDVRVLDAAPVLGALRLARQLAGAPVTAGCRPSPSPSN
jgi:N-acetylglucosamine kinase-like BadF-type ATPase